MTPPLQGLFISHSATRTGAPLVLLDLLRWLRRGERARATVVCPDDGPLLHEFDEVSDLIVTTRPDRSGPDTLRTRAMRRAKNIALRRALVRSGPFDFIYSNTLMNGEVLRWVPQDAPLISHVHELRTWVELNCDPGALARTFHRSRHYIVPSVAVRRFLMEHARVDESSVDVVPEWIAQAEPVSRANARLAVGLAPDAFVVGGIGTAEWRKGADLFVHLASLVRRATNRDTVFVWFGAVEGRSAIQLSHDIRLAGLESSVRFVGEHPNMRALVAASDLLALTSREDPYPLVVLEAGQAGVPTVCFSDAGGAPEFVAADAGAVVPYLDINAMAAEITALERDHQRLTRYAQAARVRALAHSVEELAPKALAIIEGVAGHAG